MFMLNLSLLLLIAPLNLKKNDNMTPFANITLYRRLIGKLLYLTITRPNLSFVVQQLSQYLDASTHFHYTSPIRILRHLKDSPGTGLFFSSQFDMLIKAYVNAN